MLRDLFLKLTQYTIPYGQEVKVESLLPSGFNKDSFGNYYYEIGNKSTDILFTAHLDSYCTEYEKVNHVFEDSWIKTDGKTILGADNKAGCLILINMINHKIPGTYYFFIGEEDSVGSGMEGSKSAIKSNLEFFKKFKVSVSFDRKEYGSIISRQGGKKCCSEQFIEILSEELNTNGMSGYDADPTGQYTDSYNFIGIIQEVTNLSNGVFNEHTHEEKVDFDYLDRLCNASININWNRLIELVENKKSLVKESSITNDLNKILRYKKFIGNK